MTTRSEKLKSRLGRLNDECMPDLHLAVRDAEEAVTRLEEQAKRQQAREEQRRKALTDRYSALDPQ